MLFRSDVTVADVMGYSMGGYLAIRLMRDAPQRIRRVILGGVGETYFHFWEDRADMIADGLLAPDSTLIADATAREFRRFAEAAKNDLVALAACMRRSRVQFSCEQLAALPHPTLVVCGENDAISGSPEGLARCFRDARTLIIPGRNHHMTVGDRIYKEVVVQFLGS